jgi:hypothetical protein
LHAFTGAIAPSSSSPEEWSGEFVIDRDVPAGSSIQITGRMREISGYRWLELEGAIITLSALGARRQGGRFRIQSRQAGR